MVAAGWGREHKKVNFWFTFPGILLRFLHDRGPLTHTQRRFTLRPFCDREMRVSPYHQRRRGVLHRQEFWIGVVSILFAMAMAWLRIRRG